MRVPAIIEKQSQSGSRDATTLTLIIFQQHVPKCFPQLFAKAGKIFYIVSFIYLYIFKKCPSGHLIKLCLNLVECLQKKTPVNILSQI